MKMIMAPAIISPSISSSTVPRAELKVCQSIRAWWQSSKRDSAQNPSRSL